MPAPVNLMNNFELGKKNFEDGLSLFLEKKYNEAEIKFIESLKIVPDRISTIKNLLLIYIINENKNKISNLLINYKHLEKETVLIFAKAYENFFNRKYDNAIFICNLILGKLDNELEFESLGLIAKCYIEKGFFLESLKIYKKSLFKFKKKYITYSKLGNLFFELGKTAKAKIYFQKCKNLDPSDKINLWNLSLCLLKQKKILEGFKLYENRWSLISSEPKKYQSIPELKKLKDIRGKTILIWSEQGLGDNLLFSRFIINLLNLSKEITLQIDGNLEIFKFLYPEINIIHSENIKNKKFDYQIPICSLPHILGFAELKNLNLKKFNIKEDIVENNKFKLDNNKLNIGLSLFGGSLRKYRSIHIKNFEELSLNKNIQFYNLSKKFKSDTSDYNSSKIIDLGNKNFLQLKEILRHLDIIFSIDTSLIHLLGTLNFKSYLLLNYNSDWRWFNDHEKTIWYPSVTIIKQNNFNNWDNVIEKVKKIINDKIK